MTHIGLNGGQKQDVVSDLDTRTHLITFFDNKYASSKDEEAWTLPDLAGEILHRNARAKAKLPWLKMAQFGEHRSIKNALRTDVNMVAISGIELDYDAAVMPFDAAASAFEAAGLRVLLYTSASYIAGEREKWRVLAPLSGLFSPEARGGFAAAVNAIIGGVAARESFVKSTAFYYGFVRGNEGHRVEVLDGDFIDLRPDLLAVKAYPEQIARKSPNSPKTPKTPTATPARDDAEIEALLKASRKVNKQGERQWHNVMLAATASLIGKGWTTDEIFTLCAPYCDGGWGDADIAELIRGGREKWKIPDPGIVDRMGPIVAQAIEATGYMPDPDVPIGAVKEDYYAFLPTHQYIYKYTGRLYPLASINATLNKVKIGEKPKKQGKKQLSKGEAPEMVAKSIPAALWLDRNRPVMEMTWAPGMPQLLEGQLASEGGWIERPGVSTYNRYRPSAVSGGDAASASRWVELVRAIYPDHVDHIIAFCAHRIQRADEKINHGLVLTGSPGIGKDTLLEPLKQGVGPWNFKEIAPRDVTGDYNDFMQGVVLRISETRDLGEINRYGFYEATKTILAAPPDMARVNVKHIPQFYVPNVTGVIFTTNYPTDGLYLPPDDRRHYVCGTELTRNEAWDQHCIELWKWYGQGGAADIVAYLSAYDLGGFDAKAPPEKTAAFWRMVDAGRPLEEGEFRDVFTRMGEPAAVTITMLIAHADRGLAEWMQDRKNNRNVQRRLDDCGYVPVRNVDDRTDGRWKIAGKRQVIYAKKDLSITDRYRSAEKLKKHENDLQGFLKGNVIPIKP